MRALRSFGTGLLLVAGSLALCLVGAELAVRILGESGGAVHAQLLQERALFGQTNPAGFEARKHGCRWADHLYSHGFLSYVKHPFPPCGGADVNSRGFSGPEYPFEREPGVFVLMLAGGSVAEAQAGKDDESNLLQGELNRHYTGGKIRRFVVLSAAVGGWKQPQAFIAFALHSQFLDGVVTLDGFNELPYFEERANTVFNTPATSFVLGRVRNQMDATPLLAAIAEGGLRRWSVSSSLVWHSRLVYFAVSRLRNKLRLLSDTGELLPDGRPFRPFEYPARIAPADRRERNFEAYRQDIRMMNQIARPLGVRTLHFIQPVPALDKPLSEQERRVVGPMAYAESYRKMADRLDRLNAEKIPVVSLLDTFSGDPATYYIDLIHLNEAGRMKLNEAMVRRLARAWGLRRH